MNRDFIPHASGVLVCRYMGKGDRANLERLLRSAWERQIALRAATKPESLVVKSVHKPHNDTSLFLGIISLAAVPLMYLLQANGVIAVPWILSLVIYAAINVVFVLAFLKWDTAAKWRPLFRLGCCVLLGVFILCLSGVGVISEYRAEHPTSVLTFSAFATNIALPDGKNFAGIEWKNTYGQLDLNIENPKEEAIQNVDLTIVVTPGTIFDAGQLTDVGGVELRRPERDDIQMHFLDTNKAGDQFPVTVDLRDMLKMEGGKPPSAAWKLFCPRLSGKTPLELVLAASVSERVGVADPTSIHIIGTYELAASKNSKIVKVDSTVIVKR